MAREVTVSLPVAELKLTAAERKFVGDRLAENARRCEALLKDTPANQPIVAPLGDFAALFGVMAVEMSLCDNPQEEKKLTKILQKFERVLREISPDESLGKGKRGGRTPAKHGELFQFKITLLEVHPSVWRRIQVLDCTLDQLHQHIQTAMGWTNSHLHEFEIKKVRYGVPELLDGGFDDDTLVDSTETLISDVVPKGGRRFKFIYRYDFGDSWEHEVLLEGRSQVEPGKKYPLCLDGQRACPPEDVGGAWGYETFLEALSDPKHEDHAGFVAWSGGKFSPDEFDPRQASRRMKKGLPDWREM